MEHETDFQRARRQRSEHKKFGITGSTLSEAAKNIKEHTAAKKKSVAKKMKHEAWTPRWKKGGKEHADDLLKHENS